MKKTLFGNEIEKMPDNAFRLMKLIFKLMYFFKPADKYINTFGIMPGFKVIDYGCGPGDYLKHVSRLVGKNGMVYAVDIHELAITSVQHLIKKYSLENVRPVLTDGRTIEIENNTADLVYAVDMFHMVKDTTNLLRGLNRISKPGGILIIEGGHQPRAAAQEKILKSGQWEIIEENSKNYRCRPIKV